MEKPIIKTISNPDSIYGSENVFKESLAFHELIQEKYKQELSELAKKIGKDLMDNSPEVADELKDCVFFVEAFVIAKKNNYENANA